MADPLDPAHLMGHVKDATYFEVSNKVVADGKIEIPQPFELVEEPIMAANEVLHLEAFDLVITKFMVCEVIVAVILAVFFIWVANRISSGDRPRGRLWNLLEAMLLYVRDEIARPSIGEKDAGRYLPFLWTIFFFILGCNLLGMIPWLGTPTSALGTTLALAVITFCTVVGSGMARLGVWGFWKAQVPHMELPFILAIPLIPMIFAIEIFGLLVKHFVLAIRLLANMFAGHLVLAVILAFIAVTANSIVWLGVMPASVLGAVAISLLELLVALIQAYVFTALSALFIGMALHPH